MAGSIPGECVTYEELLEREARKCKRIKITTEQSARIVAELNAGMEDFLSKQRRNEGEARLESRKISISD